MDYQEFIKAKKNTIMNIGFEPGPMPEKLFQFQKDLAVWACRKGKAALWCGTGLGKTFMQLSWADQVVKHTGRPVLILAPLAVSKQTQGEGIKIGVDVSLKNDGVLTINNYEQLHNINPNDFVGIVLDESGIPRSQPFAAILCR